MEKLNLTPEEILNKEFNVDFKGYSPAEVDSFLDSVLEDYQIMEENIQQLLDAVATLQNQVKDLTAKNACKHQRLGTTGFGLETITDAEKQHICMA